jgi:hypothetical protein
MVGRTNNQIKMYRKLAIKHLGGKCAECGSTDHLEIRHKNKDWKSNDLENLILLCSTCHRKTHQTIRYKPGRIKAHVRLRTIKGNKYLYLYTSERIGGRPRSRYVAYLGRAGLNAVRRVPRKYTSRELVERVRALEFDVMLDDVLENWHDLLVRLG